MSCAGGIDARCAEHAPPCQHNASSEGAGGGVPPDMTSTQNLSERKARADSAGASLIHDSHNRYYGTKIYHFWPCLRRQTSSAIPSKAGVTFSGSIAASAS